MNKFLQLAVDAAALKLATVTLQNLQVFPCLVDYTSLRLLFYVLSTTFFSDICLWFLTTGSVSRTAKLFSFKALFS